MTKISEALLQLTAQSCVRAVQRTGSSYTCNPPVLDTDIDFIVLVHDFENCDHNLHPLGYVVSSCATEEGRDHYENDENYGLTWYAFRRGEFNLIVTGDEDWYDNMVAATNVCKRRNVLDKEDRKAIFRFMRDGLDEDKCHDALERWPL